MNHRCALRPGTALVTGGAKRLGRLMALELARLGFDLAIHCHRSKTEAEATARDVRSLGVRAAVLGADLADMVATGSLIARAGEALGSPVRVLVNNAAIFDADTIQSASLERWRAHQTVNLEAPFILCRSFVVALDGVEPPGGLIVNMIDPRVLNPTPNYLSYSVAKSGLWALTQILARDLLPHVRVNAIAPGPVMPAPGWSAERHAALIASLPLGRATGADEVAMALRLIVEAPSLTGQMLTIDGGLQLGWQVPRGDTATG